MKIAAVRVRPVTLRFAQPVRTAQGGFSERPTVLLELRDPAGCAGFGEAAPWPGFGTESVDAAAAALHAAGMQLAGLDLQPGELPEPVARELQDKPAARAALQGALCDLDARLQGKPLAGVLAAQAGLAAREPLQRVPVGALLLAADLDELRAEARHACGLGYRAVKLKLGAGPLDADVERARAVRESLGPQVALRGDANGAWDMAAAVAALDALAPFGFEYVEQPLAAADVAGLARLRERSAVRIAADEAVASEEGALMTIALRAADVVVLKPAVLGGPVSALALARQASAAGIATVFTHTFESAVGARQALHCAAAWGDATHAHGLCTDGLFAPDVAAPVACSSGWAVLERAAGIGVAP